MSQLAHRTEQTLRRFAIVATLVAASAQGLYAQSAVDYQRVVNAAYEK